MSIGSCGPWPVDCKPGELEPGGDVRIALAAVAVHAAVQHHGRQPLAVRLQDSLDRRRVLHVRRTFIVHDHVEALGPIRIVIHRVEVLGGRIGIVGDRPFHVGASGDSLGQNLLLLRVIVAAAANHQQGADRRLRVGRPGAIALARSHGQHGDDGEERDQCGTTGAARHQEAPSEEVCWPAL